jgi:protein-tyrosine phosphatase
MRKNVEFNYVDIHCHIMFGVDDGPDNLETSREMIMMAHEEGIYKIVATPHYHPGKCTMEYDELKKRFELFKEHMKDVCPQVELQLGREIYYTSDVLEALEAGKRLTMEDTKYILVEYHPTVEYSYLRTSINNLMQMGYTPVIAHIERYICVLEDWKLAWELRNMGAVIQVNAGSVTGGSGSKVKKFIKRLMKEELVDVVGTDAHSSGRRAPRMRECAQYICKKYGEEYAKAVLRDNAERILRGEYLED